VPATGCTPAESSTNGSLNAGGAAGCRIGETGTAGADAASIAARAAGGGSAPATRGGHRARLRIGSLDVTVMGADVRLLTETGRPAKLYVMHWACPAFTGR
jgi:hypothetical protein